MTTTRDEREENAHGGIVSRSGDMATLGDGSRWWLNGSQWARNEADAAISRTNGPIAQGMTQ